MASFKIPEQEAKALLLIRDLNDGAVAELTTALAEAPPAMQRKELVDAVRPRITAIDAAELGAILQTLIGMSFARLDSDYSVQDFADLVCQTMEESENDDLKLGDEHQTFKHRLVQLLGAEPLLYPAKGFSVMYDHERLFLAAKTLTDIRGVFGSDVTESPKMAALIHTLKITYRQNETERDWHIAMDSHDVMSLIETLQRALSKTEGLKNLLGKASASCFDAE